MASRKKILHLAFVFRGHVIITSHFPLSKFEWKFLAESFLAEDFPEIFQKFFKNFSKKQKFLKNFSKISKNFSKIFENFSDFFKNFTEKTEAGEMAKKRQFSGRGTIFLGSFYNKSTTQ